MRNFNKSVILSLILVSFVYSQVYPQCQPINRNKKYIFTRDEKIKVKANEFFNGFNLRLNPVINQQEIISYHNSVEKLDDEPLLEIKDFIDTTEFYEKGQLRTVAILDHDSVQGKFTVTYGQREANAQNLLPAVDIKRQIKKIHSRCLGLVLISPSEALVFCEDASITFQTKEVIVYINLLDSDNQEEFEFDQARFSYVSQNRKVVLQLEDYKSFKQNQIYFALFKHEQNVGWQKSKQLEIDIFLFDYQKKKTQLITLDYLTLGLTEEQDVNLVDVQVIDQFLFIVMSFKNQQKTKILKYKINLSFEPVLLAESLLKELPKATFIRRTAYNDEESNDFTFFFAVPTYDLVSGNQTYKFEEFRWKHEGQAMKLLNTYDLPSQYFDGDQAAFDNSLFEFEANDDYIFFTGPNDMFLIRRGQFDQRKSLFYTEYVGPTKFHQLQLSQTENTFIQFVDFQDEAITNIVQLFQIQEPYYLFTANSTASSMTVNLRALSYFEGEFLNCINPIQLEQIDKNDQKPKNIFIGDFKPVYELYDNEITLNINLENIFEGPNLQFSATGDKSLTPLAAQYFQDIKTSNLNIDNLKFIQVTQPEVFDSIETLYLITQNGENLQVQSCNTKTNTCMGNSEKVQIKGQISSRLFSYVWVTENIMKVDDATLIFAFAQGNNVNITAFKNGTSIIPLEYIENDFEVESIYLSQNNLFIVGNDQIKTYDLEKETTFVIDKDLIGGQVFTPLKITSSQTVINDVFYILNVDIDGNYLIVIRETAKGFKVIQKVKIDNFPSQITSYHELIVEGDYLLYTHNSDQNKKIYQFDISNPYKIFKTNTIDLTEELGADFQLIGSGASNTNHFFVVQKGQDGGLNVKILKAGVSSHKAFVTQLTVNGGSICSAAGITNPYLYCPAKDQTIKSLYQTAILPVKVKKTYNGELFVTDKLSITAQSGTDKLTLDSQVTFQQMNFQTALAVNKEYIKTDQCKKQLQLKVYTGAKPENRTKEIYFSDYNFINGSLLGYKLNATVSGQNITLKNHVHLEKSTGLKEGRDFFYDPKSQNIVAQLRHSVYLLDATGNITKQFQFGEDIQGLSCDFLIPVYDDKQNLSYSMSICRHGSKYSYIRYVHYINDGGVSPKLKFPEASKKIFKAALLDVKYESQAQNDFIVVLENDFKKQYANSLAIYMISPLNFTLESQIKKVVEFKGDKFGLPDANFIDMDVDPVEGTSDKFRIILIDQNNNLIHLIYDRTNNAITYDKINIVNTLRTGVGKDKQVYPVNETASLKQVEFVFIDANQTKMDVLVTIATFCTLEMSFGLTADAKFAPLQTAVSQVFVNYGRDFTPLPYVKWQGTFLVIPYIKIGAEKATITITAYNLANNGTYNMIFGGETFDIDINDFDEDLVLNYFAFGLFPINQYKYGMLLTTPVAEERLQTVNYYSLNDKLTLVNNDFWGTLSDKEKKQDIQFMAYNDYYNDTFTLPLDIIAYGDNPEGEKDKGLSGGIVAVIVIGSIIVVGTIAFFVRRFYVKKSKDEALLSPETA